MSGDRKRFLRKGDTIINLDYVRGIEYYEDENKILFIFSYGGLDYTAIHNVPRAGFERLVSELKCGEGRE